MRDFLTAFGLLLVLEGLSYAASPSAMRDALMKILAYHDGFLRRCGFGAAFAGLVIVYFARF